MCDNSSLFNFELSPFQDKAIDAIRNQNHTLVTAHTGSGKTVPAEFAIQYFYNLGLKVIYTGPIKALCNQKYNSFREQFPHITFGILTGDIKDNPGADVLIMTTEILRNTLFKKKMQTEQKIPLMFEIDMETELGAVIFDEVHYINDPERGSVWEQSILLMPPQVQLVLLSATIDKATEFAKWIEKEKNQQALAAGIPEKSVVIASTDKRIIPLKHYMWLTMHEKQNKFLQQTEHSDDLNYIEKFVEISTPNGGLHEENYYKINQLKSHINKRNSYIKRPQVLNQLVKQLENKGMLPAIFFVFSKRHVEQCAREITISLFDKEDDTPNKIKHECDHLLRTKLSNCKDYMDLPEYNTLLPLLMKGIAIHHAGMMPILREMVEFLFEKKYIKILFATETFAVGINMPAKTVVFTDLSKFDGNSMRLLRSFEYTQMAGRAGRRGLDVIGHVIHCNNLFDLPNKSDYRLLISGKPQTLQSSFKISFHLILNVIVTQYERFQEENFLQIIEDFIKMSLMNCDIISELAQYEKELLNITNLISLKTDQLRLCKTHNAILEEYYSLEKEATTGSQKKRRRAGNKMRTLKTENVHLEDDLNKYSDLEDLQYNKDKITNSKYNTQQYIQNNILNVINVLTKTNFVSENKYIPTLKGIVAAGIQETHPLILADIYEISNGFNYLESSELAALFSCFTAIRVADDIKIHNIRTSSNNLNMIIDTLKEKHDLYCDIECNNNIECEQKYDIQYDLVDCVLQWCECTDLTQCKIVIKNLKNSKQIFLGEFIKALLKINNIATELEKICEMVNNISLLQKLQNIPKLTLKYIATNQSLYL